MAGLPARGDMSCHVCYNVHKHEWEHGMGASTTMTIRVSLDLKEKLGRLAHGTRRSRSYLAAEAVESYVNRELQIIEGIQQGLADMAAGRVTPHDEVMVEAHRIVAEARRRKAAGQ